MSQDNKIWPWVPNGEKTVWQMQNGKFVVIKEMTTRHIKNAKKMLSTNLSMGVYDTKWQKEQAEEYMQAFENELYRRSLKSDNNEKV